MTEFASVMDALTGPRMSLAASVPNMTEKPGLDAIWGEKSTWEELGLELRGDALPLYVGKAEDSVVKRDIQTHFGNGRTGSSTVRRSFAALLRGKLSLRDMPRNPAKPGYFANYGLSPEDDAKLTRWMRDRVELAVWTFDGHRRLADVERDVLREWHPPLNIAGVDHPARSHLQRARKVMADDARAWTPPSAGR